MDTSEYYGGLYPDPPEDKEYIKNYLTKFLNEVIAIIKPKEFKIDTTFGLEDPYTVGTILSALGILYVKFGDSIKIRPVFNQNVFAGAMINVQQGMQQIA